VSQGLVGSSATRSVEDGGSQGGVEAGATRRRRDYYYQAGRQSMRCGYKGYEEVAASRVSDVGVEGIKMASTDVIESRSDGCQDVCAGPGSRVVPTAIQRLGHAAHPSRRQTGGDRPYEAGPPSSVCWASLGRADIEFCANHCFESAACIHRAHTIPL
jgi:hypothetical protein